MAKFEYSSLFGELTNAVQIRFDAISQLNKKLYDSVMVEDYMDWDTPAINLNYEEILGQYNISIAAPTIGDNSKEPIMGSNGVQTMAGKVLKHAISRPMTAQTYRKIVALLDTKRIDDNAKKNELIKTMWGEVYSVVESVYGKLDLLFLRAISDEGQVVLDDTTNPEGGVRLTINYNQPSGNIATASTQWTDANKASVDCFEDIQGVIDAAQDKVAFKKILISPTMLSYLCRATNTKKLIWGTDKAAKIVQLSELNEYMQANQLPIFEPVRRSVRIQNGQTISTINPFKQGNLVFVPDGKLGIIKNAFADNELRPENGVAYSNYNRIRVSQWGVGETQNSNAVEFTKAEVLALPVITEMQGIYTLKANTSI